MRSQLLYSFKILVAFILWAGLMTDDINVDDNNSTLTEEIEVKLKLCVTLLYPRWS